MAEEKPAAEVATSGEGGPPPGFPEWDPANEGRTGYGQNDPNDPCTSMMGSTDLDTFPEGTSDLEKGSWYNYSLNNSYPPLMSSNADENRRIWQQIEFERLMDNTPTHEVHANDLPDYHYWPMIQNEMNPHPRFMTPHMKDTYYGDQSHLPRFNKLGIPKTPRQEQNWFLPLNAATGRFDWQKNIDVHGYNASLLSKRGWDRRFTVAMNRPQNPFFINGLKQFMKHPNIFRHWEIPVFQRLTRSFSGSYMDRHAMIAGFYIGFLVHASSRGAHYRSMHIDFEPWNYDITFAKNVRDKGGNHGIV